MHFITFYESNESFFLLLLFDCSFFVIDTWTILMSLMMWSEDERWKPIDDLHNQEKIPYWTVYW